MNNSFVIQKYPITMCFYSCVLFYIVLLTAAPVMAMVNLGKLCDLLSEDTYKQCYIKETLATLVHSPNQLAVDNLTNTLYFSFDSGQGEYMPALFKIDSKKLTVLKGVKDAFAIAHDSLNDEMYFGGSHGIYKYNPTLKNLKRLSVDNLDVWWLVLKNGLHFIKFPSLKAYRYENRTVKVIPELRDDHVNQFVFDEDNNIIFINSSGLFGIKNGEDEATLLKDSPRFLGIATNHAGHVYLCSDNGIHVISKMVHKVKKIVSVQGVLGITFDKDNNLIYSDSHELIRLRRVSSVEYYNLSSND